jgi:hypothetical protein
MAPAKEMTMRQLFFALACLGMSLPAYAGSETPVNLTCNVGPLNKTYGGSKWLVYSCNDNRSLVMVAIKGSPAAPFTFLFAPDKTGYDVRGQGSGNRTATDAAYKELSVLSAADVRALIGETRKH